MQCEKLEFDHKNILHEKLKNVDTPIAEYSFANLYLFRNIHDYRVVNDENVFIKGQSVDGYTFLMPTNNPSEIDMEYLREISKKVDFIFPVDEQWLQYFGKDIVYSNFEGETDYIYTVDKISTYKGRKLHKKRNLLKQFLRDYSFECHPLTDKNVHDAFEILDVWQNEIDLSPEETDFYACQEALNMHDELVLCGLIYYVEGEPAGFIMGEELNTETFVIHFAKGKKNIKGIYQFIYNDFAKRLPKKYNYLNFEQDLGKTALRIAKSSYVPDIMYKKFRVKML
ncbi:Uncharacterized conserved protein UCP018688 [Flexistipes sinusarabici DSM 4947]|uniref:Uncharacterized conserved protein UCP018688 n=2 Tax=Flexistipes sinusarabici TaxID=2352 RepID=F8E8P9_FLESM|nr:phosphatidylglycerol lysyltransferase domain-containing protein [Flexistipes sinusarabici]AEI15172.1 Uncharacterized conserved protein UCP018688 [Flexistipes sinusarabici DSM 4947]